MNDVFTFMDCASASAGWRGAIFDQNTDKWTTAQGRTIGASANALNFITLTPGQMSVNRAVSGDTHEE